ncbi:MAG: cation diffusion facilitator family transporter [Lactobacillales bacterium]|jgi:cation diffusion facilitator family transporter|nr:cation diffusion facilitator family transporter [Lactobacillales bacterium]
MADERIESLKKARRGAIVSIVAYILVSTLKVVVAHFAHSEALFADGINNVTDVFGSIAVLVGLWLAARPADKNHAFGHWKMETIASMVTSFIMFMVGLQVIFDVIKRMMNHEIQQPDMIAIAAGLASAAVMLGVYIYNYRLAKETNSQALMAAAKDNLSDVFVSVGAVVAIFFATKGWPILDALAALAVGALIIYTAYDIFREAAFNLSDGFEMEDVERYEQLVSEVEGVRAIAQIRGRSYGANIALDIKILVDPDLTVKEGHDITEVIENRLAAVDKNIFDVDVHVEPYGG